MMRYTTATEEEIFDNWFDLIEADLHTRVSGFIETMIEEELETALSRAMGGGLGLQPQDGQPHQLTPPPPPHTYPSDVSVPKRTISDSKMRNERRSRHEKSFAQVKQP